MQTPTKREQAIAKLKGAILAGHYRPGQPLRQVQLMHELALGATPVREAVLELAARGLLVYDAFQGMRVAELDRERIRDTYAVRALLESHAARRAAQDASDADIARVLEHLEAMEAACARHDLDALSRADGDFHAALYRSAGNPVLMRQIELLWDQFPRYLLWSDPDRVRASLREHRDIAQALARRDASAVADHVHAHLLHGHAAFERILGLLQPPASPPPPT